MRGWSLLKGLFQSRWFKVGGLVPKDRLCYLSQLPFTIRPLAQLGANNFFLSLKSHYKMRFVLFYLFQVVTDSIVGGGKKINKAHFQPRERTLQVSIAESIMSGEYLPLGGFEGPVP